MPALIGDGERLMPGESPIDLSSQIHADGIQSVEAQMDRCAKDTTSVAFVNWYRLLYDLS
jgi:hypothetical protein